MAELRVNIWYILRVAVANAVAGLALVGVASAGALPPMWIGILLMGRGTGTCFWDH